MAKVDALGGRTGRYYTDSVASGAEDYYAGRGESAGVWIGEGATAIGLAGEASTQAFHDALNGRDPGDRRILRSAPRTSEGDLREGVVRGFDLTFSAPKSVSVLWAAGDDRVAQQVQLALDIATADALAWLEHEACVVRRGRGGAFEFEGRGFVGVAFRHRTSRAQDPQLHTHVVVSNMAEGPDGRWTALRGTLLYRHSRTAGFVFQAVLRDQLTQRLGVQWRESPTPGVREIAGVPAELCEAFSSRRQAIEAALAGRAPSASAAQVAALSTRPTKRTDAPDGEFSLRAAWQRTARETGFDEAAVAATQDRPRLPGELSDYGLEQEITASRSTFDKGDVVRLLAAGAEQGTSLAELRARVDSWLAGPAVVPLTQLADGAQQRLGTVSETQRPGVDRWTTQGHLDIERDLVRRAMRMRGAGTGVVPPDVIDEVLAPAVTATPDQRAMVRALCSRGDGVHVVRASAGAGKTWTLDLARDAWERAGIPVIGVAQARRASLELKEQAGIQNATSIAALEASCERSGTGLAAGTVLVVDEAAMVDTRTTARLAGLVEAADGMLVLCGDDHQISEIGAGGAFAGLARRLGATTLSGNRRQRSDHERLKEQLLRLAVPEAYLRTSTEAGELVFCSGAQDARELLVAEWLREQSESPAGEHVMIARARDDVAWMNEVARSVLRRGAGDEQTIEVAEREFAVGDWVIARRNWPGGELVNGLRATVVSVDRTEGSITVAPLSAPDDRVAVPRTYLEAGHLDHGYALTAHLAQGMSVERVSVLGSVGPERGWTYSALTRHRDVARMYVVAPPALRPEIPTDVAPDLDAEEILGRDGTKALALDTLPDGSRAHGIDELRERALELEQLAAKASKAAKDLTVAEQQLSDAQDDGDGFGRVAARRWAAEVERLKGTPLLTLDHLALKQEAGAARDAFERRLRFETQRAVAGSLAVPPDRVRSLVGQRPDDPVRGPAWDRAVWRIESFRLRHLDQRQRADHQNDLGPEPTLPSARSEWNAAQRAIVQLRAGSEQEQSLVL